MDKHYRFELIKKQLEGERDEIRNLRAFLALAFDDVIALHDSIARGDLDEEAIANLPRALHLFRASARDLSRAYEDHIAPCLRDLGRPVPECVKNKWHCENDIKR